jgi:glycosyltransferase involved in cell wall biosynthesis
MLDKHWLDDLAYDVVKKYNLPQKYFVISNQFWIHKDHRTAFKALKLLHKNNKNLSDIAIVCTGATHDYRFPKYFCELEAEIKKMGLEEKIFFLGLVDRRDQIEIIKKSIAMIQPTLFEGGPGGGAVYDAISLGVPTIISDIAVNCEIGDIAQNNFYFKTKDAKNLSEKMLFVVNSHLIRPSNEQLIINNEKNIHNYGSEIVKIIFSNLNN